MEVMAIGKQEASHKAGLGETPRRLIRQRSDPRQTAKWAKCGQPSNCWALLFFGIVTSIAASMTSPAADRDHRRDGENCLSANLLLSGSLLCVCAVKPNTAPDQLICVTNERTKMTEVYDIRRKHPSCVSPKSPVL